jgi:hypothetical protein
MKKSDMKRRFCLKMQKRFRLSGFVSVNAQSHRVKWEGLDPSNHHMPFGKNPSYFIDNDEVFADAVYRISYLAKTRGKGYRPAQVKDYSTSRLKVKPSFT